MQRCSPAPAGKDSGRGVPSAPAPGSRARLSTLIELPAATGPKRAAFSLVELLVVIGILAILLAILLPTMARARESANRTACSSNLKQIGYGVLLYVHDNKGFFPASSVGTVLDSADWIWWTQATRSNIRSSALGTYLDLGPERFAVLICPSDARFRLRRETDPYIFSYSLNWMMASRSNAPRMYKKLNQVRQPGSKVLAFEEDERTIDDGNGSIWLPRDDAAWVNLLAIRHDRTRIELPDLPTRSVPVPNPQHRGNVLFCDGHADYIPRSVAHAKQHCLGNSHDFPNDP
jgi:prepilin-type N-terminal cleavage/methylation domain-containing protein/prepilin-type processing-associated H-X9-DG protein